MRIVFKIGSSLLKTEKDDMDLRFLAKLAESLKVLKDMGDQVVIVSSGAVFCGAKKIGFDRKPRDLVLRQALAGIGQAYLMHVYDTVFSNYGLTVAQVLLTADVFRKGNEDRLQNAQNTLEKMLELGVVPVINENDTVAVGELVFGDNDFLSVYVSYAIKADLLVMLSSSGGLLDGEGRIVEEVVDLEKSFSYVKGTGTEFGSGGMRSKLEATRLALSIGIPVIITGKEDDFISLRDMKTRGTLFKPVHRQIRRKLRSIAMIEEPKGIVYIDDGAIKALRNGKSLLPAGVIGAEGSFQKGDVVSIAAPDGRVVGKGKVNFSSHEIERIKGMKGYEVKELLNTTREEVIHRDNMVLFQ